MEKPFVMLFLDKLSATKARKGSMETSKEVSIIIKVIAPIITGGSIAANTKAFGIKAQARAARIATVRKIRFPTPEFCPSSITIMSNDGLDDHSC